MDGALRTRRAVGLTLLLAGAAFVAEGVIFLAEGSPGEAGATQNAVALVATVALAAAIAGFPRLYRAGRSGEVGAIVAATGLAVQGFALVAALAGGGDVFRDTIFAIGFLVMALGLITYGIAVIRANTLPRWWALAFFLPLMLLVVPGEYGVIVFGSLWLALGGLVLAARPHLDRA